MDHARVYGARRRDSRVVERESVESKAKFWPDLLIKHLSVNKELSIKNVAVSSRKQLNNALCVDITSPLALPQKRTSTNCPTQARQCCRFGLGSHSPALTSPTGFSFQPSFYLLRSTALSACFPVPS